MANYFIIEEDITSINVLKEILNESTEHQCIGISNNNEHAQNIILKEKPDLVYLNLDGLIKRPYDFVRETILYQKSTTNFIGVSASRKKAYKAIKNNFFDFILKPFNELELRKSVLKFEMNLAEKIKSTICLKSYKDFHYIDTNEILFLKADNNTTDFHMKDGSSISAFKTLKTFENSLPKNFLRIHKSYIINRDYVSRINFGKLNCTIQKHSYKIPFTKTYLNNIESINKDLSETSFLSLN